MEEEWEESVDEGREVAGVETGGGGGFVTLDACDEEEVVFAGFG